MKCENCRFSHENMSLFVGWLECRRFPPTWYQRDAKVAGMSFAHVEARAWCGEFAEREAKP